MSSAKEVLKHLKDNDLRYVDFRFTDPRGTWEHLAYRTEALSESDLEEGLMFDGSSIAGWKAINESDMRLVPDLSRVITDPFAAQSLAVIFCDVHEPATGQIYERDPRGVTRKALAYLKASGVGDEAYFGAEPEFFVFDSARFDVRENRSFFEILSDEGPYMSGHDYEEGNLGHRPLPKGGYFPVPPVDGSSDLRAEMTEVLAEMGVDAEKHHHEVAPSQHELGMRFSSLIKAADDVQIYKYVVKNVAHQYGKTATFLPKPVFGDNGSGMHVHMSIAKGGKNLFSGEGYAGLSETALHCIGGVIRHARSLNALTNPITNSYKRLVPGYEAPVLLAYSGRNRSASIRIPYSEDPKGARIEMRFPDAAANPYLCFTALLMAGLDGIRNKIHPGDAMDKNLYDLPPAELDDVATVAPSLALALDALEADHDFLTAGDVFSEDQISSYLELRREEVRALELAPHPLEFQMYYSV
jgi:glutamine synthetase